VYEYSTAEISGNTIAENGYDGSYDGVYIEYVYDYSTVDISRNTITESTDGGVYISDVYNDSSVDITSNDILDSGGYGIYIYDVYYEDSEVDINYNNIAGNNEGVYFYCNWGYYQVDATNNWWGDASGPGGYGTGTGDNVSDDVPFSPWLTSSSVWGVRVELAEGWNTFSTPIALDTASNELAELGLDMEIAYGFSGGTWTQIITTNDGLEPCEAFYVKMNIRDTFDLTPSDTYSDPPSRALSAGWNLVSLANLDEMAADEALQSAYLVSGDLTGYAQVVSPAVNDSSWNFLRGGTTPPDMLRTEGYWLFMNNAGTLAGFTSTPVLGP